MFLDAFRISPNFKLSEERVVDLIKEKKFFQWSLSNIPEERDFIIANNDLNRSTYLII